MKKEYSLSPENKSIINNRKPTICIKLNNYRNDNVIKSKMYLDGKKVKHTSHNVEFKYTPSNKLKYGKHKVKLILIDASKSKSEYKWSFRIDKINQKYHFYYGIPHAHTSFSTGKGTPLEAYDYAYNKKLDFLIVTEHSSSLRKKINYNSHNKSKWPTIDNQINEFNKTNPKFLALKGFELSTYDYGHFNVLNSSNYFKGKIKNLQEFIDWLSKESNPIVSINHPHGYIKKLNYNPVLDKYLNFIEVGNGSSQNKYMRFEKYYYYLLDVGWHIGAINAQDNHKQNWGDSDNLTAVLAESLDKTSFYNALMSRRIYSTETRSLKLLYKANDLFMGNIIKNSNLEYLHFNILAEDKVVPIKTLQIISNGNTIVKQKNFHSSSKAEWNFKIRSTTERTWYVVKVIHMDDRIGLSSPIFLK